MRIFRGNRLGDFTVYVGPWACRFTFGGPKGYFSNGSTWRSGWHRWRDEPEY